MTVMFSYYGHNMSAEEKIIIDARVALNRKSFRKLFGKATKKLEKRFGKKFRKGAKMFGKGAVFGVILLVVFYSTAKGCFAQEVVITELDDSVPFDPTKDFDIYEVSLDKRYCHPDFIDLDFSEAERIKKYNECMAKYGSKGFFGKVGTFISNNPNFTIGCLVSMATVGGVIYFLPQISEKLEKIEVTSTIKEVFPKIEGFVDNYTVKKITQQELFSRAIDAVSEAY